MNPDTTHSKRKKSGKITFMLVPSDTGKVRKLTLPRWVLTCSAICLAVLLGSLAYSLSGWEEARAEFYDEALAAARLQQENRQHLETIEELEKQYQEVDQMLQSLRELENRVLEMVGLEKTSEEPVSGIADEMSESRQTRVLSTDVARSGADNSPSHLNTSLNSSSVSRSGQNETVSGDRVMAEVQRLEESLKEREESMDQLAQDVEERLAYLDAQPNQWPAYGRITSGFGNRTSPTNRYRTEFHSGLDIASRHGSRITAAGSGEVIFSGYHGGYGRKVVISHGYGYQSVYAHNSQNLVNVGDQVEEGETIALMGRTGRATGVHVHFEIRVNGEPVDPMKILR